jgi:DNA-binding NarL/FixJ family response regulator
MGPTADRRAIVPIRVLVVDDHEIVRNGVRFLLSDETQYHICGEADNGIGAIEQILKLSPDVVVLDLILPLMNGYETAARIRKIAPLTKIVFFSVHEIPTSAQMLGADAFVPKSHLAEELASTIRSVVQQAPLR